MVDEDGHTLDGHDHPVMATLRTGTRVQDVVIGLRQQSGEMKWLSITTEPLVNETTKQFRAKARSFACYDFAEKEGHRLNLLPEFTTGIMVEIIN